MINNNNDEEKKNCTYVNSEGFVSGYQYCGIYPLICGGGCDWGGGWCVCIWGGLWSQCGGFWSHGAWVGGLKPKFFKEINKQKVFENLNSTYLNGTSCHERISILHIEKRYRYGMSPIEID